MLTASMPAPTSPVLLAGRSCFVCQAPAARRSFPRLTGPYFGQTPPGKTPEPFAASIAGIHTELHGIVSFSPDGEEAFWKTGFNPNEGIRTSRLVNGTWSRPTIAPFSADGRGDDAPFVSPDGARVYFLSRANRAALAREIIWVTDRVAGGWSMPRPMPASVNTPERIHWLLSVDRRGDLYFSASPSADRSRERFIYCAGCNKGTYSAPTKLGPTVNPKGSYNFSPFVSPDATYLLFSRLYPDSSLHLFVSFRKADGSWTGARCLDDRLGHRYALNPSVTPDGRYLLFLADPNRNIPYWVDASVIEDMRRTVLQAGAAGGFRCLRVQAEGYRAPLADHIAQHVPESDHA